jgi:hypothetical protein
VPIVPTFTTCGAAVLSPVVPAAALPSVTVPVACALPSPDAAAVVCDWFWAGCPHAVSSKAKIVITVTAKINLFMMYFQLSFCYFLISDGAGFRSPDTGAG